MLMTLGSTCFLKVEDKVAPIKIIRVKQRSEPWMNSDILGAIYKRNKSFLDFSKSKDQADKDNHKKHGANMIRESKGAFFSCDKITEQKSNLN